MKIEEVVQTKTEINQSKKAVLNIFVAQISLSERFNEILKPFDLSAEQFNVLRILRGQNNKPCNMFLIQERMLSKTSNTTRLVDKLLIKELVTRKVCDVNRRKIEVLISQKGLDLLKVLDPKIDDFENNFSNNLTENELEQFNFLLEKYRK